MTFDQIVTKVITRLREGGADAEYSTLIGEFVNEVKREVEDAHSWTALRNTVTINTVQGTTAYSLTGAGKRSVIFDVYETTTNSFLRRGNAIHMKTIIEEASQGQPFNYYVEGVDSSGDIKVHLAMVPDAVYTYNFHLKTPQADLTTGVEITIDEWPVILGAYSMALEERGEDGGTQADRANTRYVDAVSDAIQLDIALTHDEDTWYV